MRSVARAGARSVRGTMFFALAGLFSACGIMLMFQAFQRGEADVVVVTDVYGAGEAPIPGISGRTVADAVARSLGPERVRYVPGRAELAGELAGLLAPGDLCLSLGAGDLTALPDEVLDLLRAPDVR